MAKGDIDADRRNRFLDAAAQGFGPSEIARRCGYTRVYVHNLQKEPGIPEAIAARRKELYGDAGPPRVVSAADTKDIHKECVDALRMIVKDQEAQYKDRLAAAKILIQSVTAAPKRKAGPSAPPPPEPVKQEAPETVMSPEEIRELLRGERGEPATGSAAGS